MASSKSKTPTPWYKEKLRRSEYLHKGDPVPLGYADLRAIREWREIEVEKYDMWEESKSVIDQKNKKREYLIDYPEEPVETENGYSLKIEILHRDYRGIIYTAENRNVNVLKREFWPVIEELIAIFFSPRIASRPAPLPYFPEDEDKDFNEDIRRQLLL